MKIPLGPTIAVTGLAIVAAMVTGGWWWWQNNARKLGEAANEAYAEGRRAGARQGEKGCVGEALARHADQQSQTIVGTIRNGLVLRGCLETSKAEAKFCDGVPPEDEIFARATWATQSCAGAGLGDSYCPQ